MARSDVLAVLVLDGDRSAVTAGLAALGAQTRRPDRTAVVVVGTMPDALRDDLETARHAGTVDEIVTRPSGTRDRDAVDAAVAAVGTAAGSGPDWLWLLRGDSAPSPGALRALGGAVEVAPSVAVAGAKQLRPLDGDGHRPDPDRAPADADGEPLAGEAGNGPLTSVEVRGLINVGVRLSPWGRIDTATEPGEIDQGQLDHHDEVLAVSGSALLVRTDAWTAVGGLDPLLPRSWAAIDLCWKVRRAGHRVIVVPSARALHVPDPPGHVRPGVVARAATVEHNLIRHAAPSALAYALLLPLITVLRCLARIVEHRPARILDEVGGALSALRQLPGVLRSRRRHRRAARVPRRRLRPLLVSAAQNAAWHRDRLVGSYVSDRDPQELRTARLREGTAGSRDGEHPGDRTRHVVSGLVLATLLLVVAVVASRHLLAGGPLAGGALTAADPTGGSLRTAATLPWIATGLGASALPAPIVALLALVPVDLDLVVRVALFGAVPLAGLGAYRLAGFVVRPLGVRLVLGALYALAPPAVAALAAGRLPELAAHALLVWFAACVAHALGRPGRPRGSVAAAAAAGLLGAVLTATAPILLPGVLLVALGGLALARGRRPRFLLTAAPAVLTWVPHARSLVASPRQLLASPGTDAASPLASSTDLLTLWPVPAVEVLAPLSGTENAAWLALVLAAPLLLVALGSAPLTNRAAPGARLGWIVAAVGLAGAVLATRLPAGTADGAVVTGWPGAPLSVAVLGLLLAAAAGLESLAARSGRLALDAARDGRRPAAGRVLAAGTGLLALPALALVAVLVVAVPAVSAIDPADRAVPAAAADAAEGPGAARTLVLGAAESGTVDAELWRHGLPRASEHSGELLARTVSPATAPGTGPAQVVATGLDSADTYLATIVAQLITAGSGAPDRGLALTGIAHVWVPGDPADQKALVGALDVSPALQPVSRTTDGALWRVLVTPTRGAVVAADWADANSDGAGTPTGDRLVAAITGPAPADPVPLATGPDGVTAAAELAAGGERTVVLAERADSGWSARIGGTGLEPVVVDGWAQGFAVPDGAEGSLTVTHDDGGLRALRVLQGVGLLLVVLVAVPWRRVRPTPPDQEVSA